MLKQLCRRLGPRSSVGLVTLLVGYQGNVLVIAVVAYLVFWISAMDGGQLSSVALIILLLLHRLSFCSHHLLVLEDSVVAAAVQRWRMKVGSGGNTILVVGLPALSAMRLHSPQTGFPETSWSG